MDSDTGKLKDDVTSAFNLLQLILDAENSSICFVVLFPRACHDTEWANYTLIPMFV